MRIPTVGQDLSMNLGQAVALCLYEMARDPKAAAARPVKIASATAGETEQITLRLLEALARSGYVNPVTAASTDEKVRRLVRRLEIPAQRRPGDSGNAAPDSVEAPGTWDVGVRAWQYLPFLAMQRYLRVEAVIMQTMNISLPEQLKEFVDHQVGSGRYSSVSEYVRELIREDEKRKAQEKLEALLMEGIQSSGPAEMTRQDWDDIRREALKQFEARKFRKKA